MDDASKEKAREKVHKQENTWVSLQKVQVSSHWFFFFFFFLGHGNEGAYWLSGSYFRRKQPEAWSRVCPRKSMSEFRPQFRSCEVGIDRIFFLSAKFQWGKLLWERPRKPQVWSSQEFKEAERTSWSWFVSNRHPQLIKTMTVLDCKSPASRMWLSYTSSRFASSSKT